MSFEMLVITPPKQGPSILQDTNLYKCRRMDVDLHTLMHREDTTIFSLGDAASLPTVKMDAAVKEHVADEVLACITKGKNIKVGAHR